MHEMLFSKFDPALGFREENAHFPDPAAPEIYDPAIAAAGGLDLQLLGIGFNGHIAFNEPMREDEISADDFAALPTRVLPLSKETIAQNTKVTADGDASLVPRYAATMGMAPILAAKKCLLLACFEEQTVPLKAIMAKGAPTPLLPASYLWRHPDFRLIYTAGKVSLT
jgi:glucosamine-6-phosphate deaminase